MKPTKTFRLSDFKTEGDAGSFRATIATLNVIDKDDDVSLPGAFKVGQEVKIAPWGHNWGDLPVGKGVIGADETHAWVDGQFFLETDAGMQTYLTVKAMGGLQEWSYGYQVEEYSFGLFEGQQVRFLKGLNVIEASPVMIGAGEGTGTDRIKSAGQSLDEHSGTVLAAVTELAARLKSLADLRAKEGRMLSAANMERLKAHHDALTALCADMGDLLASAAPPKAGADEYETDEIVLGVYAEFLRLESRLSA